MPEIDPEDLTFDYTLKYRGIPNVHRDPEDYPMRWQVTIDSTAFNDDGGDLHVGHGVHYMVPMPGRSTCSPPWMPST
ncbi:hypothetical protein ACQCSX_01875 [Pseudarthrobacter sp. P1]|uniref:hypothetical protein n=1 Tax=Pseudarthrobacter sp. P1 TaxID=3418418 RepID=UPI003CE9573A